jgi:hypothetical protein
MGMKKILSLICIAGLLAFAGSAFAEQFKPTRRSNIRSGPGTVYDIVGTADPETDQWEILAKVGNWYRIGEDRYIYNGVGRIVEKHEEQPQYEYTIKTIPNNNAVQNQKEIEELLTRQDEILKAPAKIEGIEDYQYNMKREITTYESKTTMDDSDELLPADIGTGILILLSILLWLVLWIIPSIVCSEAAERKGLSRWAFFFFSLFFSPMLGFLAVIAFPVKSKF